MKNKSLKATVLAGSLITAAGLLTGGVTAGAAQYPLPPTTTISQAAPIPPPATLPRTGSDTVNDTVLIGATIAAAGGGLLLVSRRRRDRTAPTQ